MSPSANSMKNAPRLLVLLLVLGLPSAGSAQVVSGRVTDAATGRPLGGVEIVLLDTLGEARVRVVSDSIGRFALAAPAPGEYLLRAARIGYDTVRAEVPTLEYAESIDIELRLGVRPLTLDVLTVTARRRDVSLRARDMRDYYARVDRNRHLIGSRIFTREWIDRYFSHWTYDELARRVFPPFRRAGHACEPTVYWNGVPISFDVDIPLTSLEGVEVYRGIAPTDSRFTDIGACGVVLVWTRDDDPNAHPITLERFLVAVGAVIASFLIIW